MPTNKKKKGKPKNKAKVRSKRNLCYHGSAEENFRGDADYEKAIADLFRRIETFQGDPGDRDQVAEITKSFVRDHANLVFDTKFCSHMFAWCARECLKSELRHDGHFAATKTVLSTAINLRYYYIAESNGEDVSIGSRNEEKITKYQREIYTRDGALRRVAREVPCDCLSAHVEEAKMAGKTGMCFGCDKQFPMTDLFGCTRCGSVDYCGLECQERHWPKHKELCDKKKEMSKTKGKDFELEMLKMKQYMDAMINSKRMKNQPAEERKVFTNFVERKEPKLKKQAGLPLQAGDVVRIEALDEEQYIGSRGIVLRNVSDGEPLFTDANGLSVHVNDKVKLAGLSKKAFNGLFGTVQGNDWNNSGRLAVLLDGHDEAMSFKCSNISSAEGNIAEMKYVIVIEGSSKPAKCRGGKKHEERSIASKNLRKYRPLPLPTGIERGRVIGNPPRNGWSPKARAWRLVENLVYQSETYKPSEIMFMGEACNNFMQCPGYPDAYECLSCAQIEQLGGLLAIARMAATEGHAAEVVFALLEADPMVIDVIIMLFTCTPYIGLDRKGYDHEAFRDVDPFSELTPPQESDEYIYTIQHGHLKLLTTIVYQEFYQAVVAVLRRSRLFHLFVRRLLLIISREVDGHLDGIELARYCKGLLDILCELRLDDDETNEQYFLYPLPQHVGRDVLSKTSGLKTFEDLRPVLQSIFNQL